MGIRTKTLITLLLVGSVVGVLTYTSSNESLFKGQIFTENESPDATEEIKLPDLMPKLEVLPPSSEGGDITASATIKNNGEGYISGSDSFKYAILINDQEVISNTDSFTEMAPGDSFDFEYPIPRTIYSYENTGTVKFVLDIDNSIQESDEGNNEVVVEYSL